MALRIIEAEPQEDYLYENMKHVVWMVKIQVSGIERRKWATGFCIHQSGYILTSDFRLVGASNISVRSYNMDDFIDAERVGMVPSNSGLALLKVAKNSDYAQLGDDVGLSPGTNVFGIAHQMGFYFTSQFGMLVSPLRLRSEVHMKSDDLAKYINKLSPDLPLLEIHGFDSSFETQWLLQTLGAPIFNSRGCVIGMVIASSGGYDYAVPAKHLTRVFEQVAQHQHGVGEGSSGRGHGHGRGSGDGRGRGRG